MINLVENGIYIPEKCTYKIETKAVTDRRITKFYEFELHDKSDDFYVVDNIVYYRFTPHIIIAKPGMERFNIGNSGCHYFKFVTEDDTIKKIVNSLPVFISVNYEKYFELFNNLVSYNSAFELNRNLYKTGCAMQIISLLADKYFLTENSLVRSHRHGENILRTKEFMDSEFGQHITLESLAQIAYLSKNFYRTVFTEIMGISPQKYLTKIRIANALKMITAGGFSYNEISRTCGFESQAYMNYIIKKETGKTPSQYKNSKASE